MTLVLFFFNDERYYVNIEEFIKAFIKYDRLQVTQSSKRGETKSNY